MKKFLISLCCLFATGSMVMAQTATFELSKKEKKQGFEVLFDGTNLDKWQGNKEAYTVKDGCIKLDPTKRGGNIYTQKEYSDFIYRFEFKLVPGANNGVGIRTVKGKDAAYVGNEIQILDCEHERYKNLNIWQHHGSVYGIIPASEKHKKIIKPVGEWNKEEIYIKGDYIRVKVNGKVITEGNIKEEIEKGTIDKRKHVYREKGLISFCGHGSPVEFRNIRIKELK